MTRRPRRIILTALITFLVTVLVAPGTALLNWQFIQKSVATPTNVALQSQPQAITIYEPILKLEWEGQFISPYGIAYFSVEGVSPNWLSSSSAQLDGDGEGEEDAKKLFEIGLNYHVVGGLYDQAINYYKKSLEIEEKLGYSANEELKGVLLANLGLAYAQNGLYYTDTFDYLEPYWQFIRQKVSYYNADRRLEAQALSNLGNAYYGADLYAQAIEFHQKRLALSREIKDRQGEGKALGDLGIVYHALGEYPKATDYQQQRLAIAREIKDRRAEGQALSNLGIIHHSQGDYAKAIEYQQQYLAISEEIKDPLGKEQALSNLGGAYYFLGDYARAIDLYEKSLAVAWDNREANIANRVRGNLGLAYFQRGDDQKSIELYKRFFSSASYTASRRGEAVARNNLAVAELKSGDMAGATESLLKGIQALEDLRKRLGNNDAYKVSIFETQNFPYINLQKLLIAQDKSNAALEIAERGRARAFVELLTRRLSSKVTEKSTISPLTIEQIKQIAKTQNATLVEYSIISENFKIQEKLQTHESELYIWVIKPTGEVAFRQVDLKRLWQEQKTSLQDLVIGTRESIGVRGRGLTVVSRTDETKQRQRLPQFYELLIQPIAELLPSEPEARVIFIPQGELFLVPFAALQDASGKYLIEKHTILTAPSIQVLELTHQQQERLGRQGFASLQGKDALIVGNPTMPSIPPKIGEPPQQLPSLPGAEQEAIAIAQLLNTQAIIGDAATKAAILPKMMQARIIHLATHGLLDDFTGDGVPGAIALAPDPSGPSPTTISSPRTQGGVNGLLTANEILDLKLNAELVVLSACDTGRGRITGDGVIGLSRSLISAGVPSVIVSLWSVPDAPTASLMTEFYRNLQQKLDNAQALRSSILTTMKQYPNPINWAAFTLIGEAG